MARLEAARTLPLILVSAPPGYGKSTLVASWLARTDWPSVWVSLDAQDGDLRRFLAHVVAGLRNVFPEACPELMDLVTAPTAMPLRAVKTAMANGLDALPRPFVLVLDDYHHVGAGSPAHELLGDLLAYPPVPLHLVLIARRDPPIPLVALRARGQLAEIRMADLRFEQGEARELLEHSAGFAASADGLANVERELEGWAAGVRLVSLALRADPDPNAALSRLRGGLQQTQEYLFQQVLARQADAMRGWLLRSAIFERFCGVLCDAACGGGATRSPSPLDGEGFVRALVEGNLFVVQLDSKGEWIRYHPLFRALLQRELANSLPAAEISRMHSRAGEWFEGQGLIEEAIQHALEAGDASGAADIVGRRFLGQLDEDRWYVVDRWLGMLPPAVRCRPDLRVAEGWVRYEKFQLASLPAIVEDVTSGRAAPGEPSVRGGLAFFRGVLAYLAGDNSGARRYLEEAKAGFAGRRMFAAGLAELWLGLARCASGEDASAVLALEGALRGHAASADRVVARLVAGLNFVDCLSGRLVPARREAARLIDIGRRGGVSYTTAWGHYLEGAAWLQAVDTARAVEGLAAAAGHVHILHVRAALDTLAGLALAYQLHGQPAAAAKSLDRLFAFARDVGESEALAVASSSRARLALSRGEAGEALGWARATVLERPSPVEVFIWVEVPQLTQARVLAALGGAEDLVRATDLLTALLALSEQFGYRNRIIEIRALLSLALERQGRSREALASLREALLLAEPGGWMLPFAEAGRPMATLLERVAGRDGLSGFRTRLREAVLGGADRQAVTAAGDLAGGPAAAASGASLTRRELEMLALLAQRLQNKEIAARLFVSPETVKTHLKNLYQKLGIGNRRQAAAKAAEIVGYSLPGTGFPGGSDPR